MNRWAKTLILLLPVAAFIGGLYWVQKWLYNGHALWGLGLLVGSLAVLAIIEGLLMKFWFLPGVGSALAERLYGGQYYPEEDALAVLVRRIQEKRETSALPELEKIVRADPHRLRGWQEWAHLQRTLGQDTPAAVNILVEGARHVRSNEDRAMLLYRAAALCQESLRDSEQAETLWEQAARRYPATVYGRRSADQLHHPRAKG